MLLLEEIFRQFNSLRESATQSYQHKEERVNVLFRPIA